MRGRPRKYPWHTWLDGERHVLARGRDFTETTAFSLQKQTQTEARKLGIKVRTKVKVDDAGVEWLLIDGREQPAPRKRHDWDGLFKRAARTGHVVLNRGTDFTVEAETMRVMASQAAKRRQLTISTRVIESKQLVITLAPHHRSPTIGAETVTEMAPTTEESADG